jgi:ribosome modulation factor
MTSGFPLRRDMSRPRAEGYEAFKDGASVDMCPYAAIDPEWRDGYEKAQRDQEKHDEKFR